MPLRFLTLLLIVLPLMADGPSLEQPRTLVDQYVAASQVQKERLQGMAMEVEIEAELPKLKKKGHLLRNPQDCFAGQDHLRRHPVRRG
jgi:hypothetical protein